MLQEAALEQELTVREAIELYGAPYPSPLPADEVAELVGLGDRLDARTRTLSGGQRRRLDLAVGIAGDPELIFLDEPTTGFDPAARRQSWELIAGLRALGKTILLTTHYMEEAQRLADRVVVLVDGRLIAVAAPDELGGEDTALVSFRLPDGVEPGDLPVEVDGQRAGGRLPHRHADQRPRAAALVGGGPRLRARGPDRQPAEPRGRLSHADRGGRMTRYRPLAAPALDRRARVRLMLRNPRVTFFTFAFPLMFLVIFSAINGDVRVPAPAPRAARSASRSSTRRRSASSASRSPATRT